MKFEEALKAMREGKKVYRLSYPRNILSMRNKKIFVGGRLCIELPEVVITAEDWEIEPATDWDYIIKNKCLCWFWEEENKRIGMLKKYEKHKFSMIIPDNYVIDVSFTNCRPVRKDEVTFYEDKKDDDL